MTVGPWKLPGLKPQGKAGQSWGSHVAAWPGGPALTGPPLACPTSVLPGADQAHSRCLIDIE